MNSIAWLFQLTLVLLADLRLRAKDSRAQLVAWRTGQRILDHLRDCSFCLPAETGRSAIGPSLALSPRFNQRQVSMHRT
jgi:hypothetical protein